MKCQSSDSPCGSECVTRNMLRQRQVERLQRLRQHHEHCAKRYEEEITEKNQRDHDKNLQLIKMMKGQKTEEEEEKEMDCVTHGSLSESSHDLEIDYVPSESDSSNNSSCHDVNMKLTLKKNRKKLREADTTTAQELTNLYEKISSTDDNDKDADDQDTDYSADNEEEEEEEEERSQITVKFCIKGGKLGAGQESQVSGSEAQDSDEEPDILTEKTPTPRPSRKLYRTEKTASSKEKRTRRISEPVQDSDEEPDILAQKTPTPRPSRKLYRTDKTGEPDILTQRTEKTAFPKGKKSRKITEPVQDSDEEQHILTQKTSTPRPSDKLKRTEKRGMDPQFLSQKKCHRRPWGSEEKAAVWRQLGQYSTLNRVPGKELCLKALDAEPILCHRDWRDVKNQVYNSITSQKMER
ncbi:uncharacterized protein DDB_G0283697-like isoform X5 [Chelmon rostratus]|uniref:uncharacterized protein DDB_G0283697-like isoform X5 n=1 Tax=Chelmon rostratus TaxID=109905 RepID=UPI001BE757BF|nr:uncharacterized protein DDB_G0283697-like isoform X5 [Chelmon rostratus]